MTAITESPGQLVAERRVVEHLRAALDTSWRLYPNARWLGSTAPGRAMRDGEAHLVIAHPEHGLLVLEVKSGPVSRDAQGRWWSGSKQHVPGPFEQAEGSAHALAAKLVSLPAWRAGIEPLAGHAVAFPDVELASAGPGARLLGPDVDARLVLDHVGSRGRCYTDGSLMRPRNRTAPVGRSRSA